MIYDILYNPINTENISNDIIQHVCLLDESCVNSFKQVLNCNIYSKIKPEIYATTTEGRVEKLLYDMQNIVDAIYALMQISSICLNYVGTIEKLDQAIITSWKFYANKYIKIEKKQNKLKITECFLPTDIKLCNKDQYNKTIEKSKLLINKIEFDKNILKIILYIHKAFNKKMTIYERY